MLSRRFVTTMILMLILAYLGALAVSTAHLSQLYALFNAGLPYWVSIGLAVALEVVAFLFSIISTSLGKRAGPWAAWASTSALLLVWAGNGYAMMLAAPTLMWYIVLAASCFVPVCTLMVGKVLGGLFGLLDELGQQEREERTQRPNAAVATVTAPAAVILSRPAVRVRELSPLLGQRLHDAHVVVNQAGQQLVQGVSSSLDGLPLLEVNRRENQPAIRREPPAGTVEANPPILEEMGIVSPSTPTAPPFVSEDSPTPSPGLLEPQLHALGLGAEEIEVMVGVWSERRGNQQQGGKKPKVEVSIRDEVALALLGSRGARYAVLAQQLGIGERRARTVATEVQALMKTRNCWVEATA